MRKPLPLRHAWVPCAALCAIVVTACGGGGGAGTGLNPTPSSPTTAAVRYPNSLVSGLSGPQSVTYIGGDSAHLPAVSVDSGSALLKVGATAVIAEHSESDLPDIDIICVSGNGESTNVVTQINLGVVSESAAVLMGAGWKPVDSVAAWTRAVTAGTAWSGWENCGVKPEGLPSRSSQLVPTADGGYLEDVFNGNPSTTFIAIRRAVDRTAVAALLSDTGQVNAEVPSRPLVMTLRAYSDETGHTVFVQTGVPGANAPDGVKGFIALYVPA